MTSKIHKSWTAMSFLPMTFSIWSSDGGDDEIQAPLTTMASAILFGAIMFATVALAARSLMVGDYRALKAAQNVRSSALDIRSIASVYTLLQHSSVFGLILFYAYICENHPPFPHSDKHYDADIFFFLTALLFVISAFTLKQHESNKDHASVESVFESESLTEGTIRKIAEPNDATEILNRDQTEEWKGWMQFMFLLYHYYHAEDVYNAIRIMITCYVWMTGFGNFSFFYLKSDYGWVRVLQMLWRLNFLVLFLCLTQGTTYILYYICLLHTYYFLVVYVTMRIGKDYNYTKWWIRIKLMVLAFIIFIIWDVNSGIFQFVHHPFFGTSPMLGATNGSMWEWYFRSSLDHWSTYLGMVFALNFPITSLLFRKLEAQPLFWHVSAKLAMAIGLIAAFWLWVSGPFQLEKLKYNQTNAYFGFVPLITYIFFRNLTPKLRQCSMDLLHQIGKTTLETYLMQHHIWLTSNAKSLLTLIQGWPKMNFLLVSLLYVFLSRRLYQLTLFLRGMILPDDSNACFANLAAMSATILGSLLLAFCLRFNGLLNLTVVGICAIGLGILLYQVVLRLTAASLDMTDKSDKCSVKGEDSVSRPKNQFVGPFLLSTPAMMGAAVVLILGITWQEASTRGATRIKRLPAHCSDYVNHGAWIPIDGCVEGYRGQIYRKYGISSVSTCTAQNHAYIWGWNETLSSEHCRFTQRDKKSLKRSLSDRTLCFVGDSVTRYVYNSFCRQMGMSSAGAYNATGDKHVDVHNRIAGAQVDFEWAPYVTEQVERVKAIAELPLHPIDHNSRRRPDLVVLGGGAWDRLWNYSSNEERSSFRVAVGELATQIQHLRSLDIPVVWVVPSTINNNALPTPEKRENIAEEQMEEIRSLYEKEKVLSSSSFVLDARSFTSGRVAESFDGVHYPHQVYTAGAQILANAMDWLLEEPEKKEPSGNQPHPGTMSHSNLGLLMFCFIFFGLVGFDGFLGFSYLASVLVPSVSPKGMYEEAFSSLHRRKKLPDIAACVPSQSLTPSLPPSRSPSRSPSLSSADADEETASLLDKDI